MITSFFLRKLVKIINKKQNNWDECIDTALFSLRTERQTTTKFSPFEIMFNRQPVFPSEMNDFDKKSLEKVSRLKCNCYDQIKKRK